MSFFMGLKFICSPICTLQVQTTQQIDKKMRKVWKYLYTLG